MTLDPRFHPISITTSDDLRIGEHGSIRNHRFEDFYFNPGLGKEEGTHVFIEGNNLGERWRALHSKKTSANFVLAETGFGTGLNFLLALDLWLKSRTENGSQTSGTLHYFSLEKYPLSRQALTKVFDHYNPFPELAQHLLNLYPDPLSGQYFINFEQLGIPARLYLFFSDASNALEQLECYPANSHEKKSTVGLKVDAWFLDGFAPRENDEMWNSDIFSTIASLSKPGTTAATFTVAGSVKRGLKNAGFDINKRPGFGKKREMLTATFKQSLVERPTKPHANAFFRLPNRKTRPRSIAIVGAGIAGCSIANRLAKEGIRIDLYESNKHLASEASGNTVAALHPRTAKQRGIHSDFLELAFHYAYQHYRAAKLSTKPNGLIQIDADLNDSGLADPFEVNARQNFSSWYANQCASSAFGSGILYPDAGAIKPAEICKELTSHKNINVLTKHQINAICAENIEEGSNATVESGPRLRYTDNNHTDNNHQEKTSTYDAIVIASGSATQKLLQKNLISTENMAVKNIRGQTTQLKLETKTDANPGGFDTNALSPSLVNKVLCGNGYLYLQEDNSAHTLSIFIGASYVLDSDSNDISTLEFLENLDIASDLLSLHPNAYSAFITLFKDIRFELKQRTTAVSLSSPTILDSRFGRVTIENHAALRCTSPDYLPVVGPLFDEQAFIQQYKPWAKNAKTDIDAVCPLKHELYVCTALGSHGFGTAPILAEAIASDILGSPSPLCEPLRTALSPQRFLLRNIIRGKLCQP